MLVPTGWLSEFVPLDGSTGDLVYDLTQIGLEVEDVLTPAENLENLLIVSLDTVQEHPNRDSLSVCTINDDREDHTIVTAAENLDPDARYVWAPPGSRLDQRTINEENLAGVPSEGMLCSLEDMLLTGSSSALLQLSEQFTVGSDAVEALDLTEPILEIDLTPNRSDCLSIVGVARDYATATGNPLNPPQVDSPDTEESIEEVEVRIKAEDRCFEYTGIPVSGVTVEPSGPSIQKRLVQLGMQPRNCVVDATNYVLHEMGNPLHAFDRSRLTPPVTVRTATGDETITTLDGSELELNGADLVIADESQPRALAGIMGGRNSEVTDSTTSLLLEGAYFTPAGIRRTSTNHQISTESSYRFERGVDGGNITRSLHRCLNLIGRSENNDDIAVHEPASADLGRDYTTTIQFNPSDFETLIGYERTPDVIRDRLEKLGCSPETTNGSWTVTTPTWRHDLTRPEDLLEEIVRLDGYESVASEYPTVELDETPEPRRRLEQQLQPVLTAQGFHETKTFSFLPADDHVFAPQNDPHRIANPLSRQHATMRQTLLDRLRTPLANNLDAGRDRVNLFEIGRVFPADDASSEVHLGLISTGPVHSESWDDRNHPSDFYDLKGLLQLLLTRSGHPDHDFLPDSHEGFLENRCATIKLKGADVGRAGELDPGHLDSDPEHSVWGAEINLSFLGESDPVKYNPFSKQPVVKRDLDLVVDRDQYARSLKETIRSEADWLEDIRIFDLYRGDPLPEDKKSISFRMFFRNPERTLNDEEVNEVQEQILNALRDQHGAYLRDE